MKDLSPEQIQRLIAAAQEGMENAFTSENKPDDFRIGAAVLTNKGNIYSSGQYDSNTSSLTLHAEQAALAHAAAHGEYGIVAVAVTANEAASSHNNGKLIYPCHMCKQLLWESYLRSGVDMDIFVVVDGSVVESLSLKDIMSYTWP